MARPDQRRYARYRSNGDGMVSDRRCRVTDSCPGHTRAVSLDPKEFALNTTTFSDGNVVSESQLNQGSDPDGSLISGRDGAFHGEGESLDLSQVGNDVFVSLNSGKIAVDADRLGHDSGSTRFDDQSAGIDGYAIGTVDYDSYIETLITGAGDDYLIGTEAVEIFDAGLGDNLIDGGEGTDRLMFGDTSALGVTPTVATKADVAGGQQFSFATAPAADVFSLRFDATAATQSFATLAALVVALEAQFAAANGNITVEADEGSSTVTITAEDQLGQELLGSMDIQITAQALNGIDVDLNGVYGIFNAANEAVFAGAGKVIRGAEVDYVKNIEDVFGTAYDDILAGDNLENYLAAGAGSDEIYGMDGDDTLDGGDDNDVVFGGSGDDTIIGGAGADLMFGGSGRDTFVISDSLDTIGDFNVSAFMTSTAGRNTVYDRIEFEFNDDDIQDVFAETSVPETLQLRVMLDGAMRRLLSGSLLAVNPTVALELQVWNGESRKLGRTELGESVLGRRGSALRVLRRSNALPERVLDRW